MKSKFAVLFMDEAREFLLKVDDKAREKIIFNIDRARLHNDKELFKKLTGEIWEFRTLFNRTHYRLFAFWDKTSKQETLVIAAHGIIKKTEKTPDKEIVKAESLRLIYFKLKK
jgi:phage-related protein